MDIVLDIVVYFVGHRVGHMKILPYGIENVSFFSIRGQWTSYSLHNQKKYFFNCCESATM